MHDVSKGKWGGGVGFFANIAIVDNDIFDSAWLYLVPQIEYNMMGEFADANPALYEKQKFYHDYISFQAYIKYFFHKGNMKRDVFLFAGPKVELLVREKREVPAQYDTDYFKYNYDDEVNSLGLGVSVGAGLKINQQLEGFIRYDRGLSKVYPNNNFKNTANQMLSLGFNYYLNKNW